MTDNGTDSIRVRLVRSVPEDDLARLYIEAGWWDASLLPSPEVMSAVVRDCTLFAAAFEDRGARHGKPEGLKMVGMGRAISDGVSDAYIQDVTVLSTYRGRGLGSRIVQCLVAELTRRGIDWVGLVAMPGTASFYEPLGFEPMADFVPMKYKHQD